MARSATVHPLLPRVSQAITGVMSLEALVFQDRGVVLVALGLVLLALLAPKYSPVHWVFRRYAVQPDALEPVAPVRFAQWMAVVMLAAASVFIAAGWDLAGWVIVAIVAAVAIFSALSGVCVGCEIYRLLMARNGADGDVRDDLRLDGAGPWLVVLTAPGCTRCEPVAKQLEAVAGNQAVTRIDLSTTPAAARLPVKSVPAVIAIGRDGHVLRAFAGRFDRERLEEAVAAV